MWVRFLFGDFHLEADPASSQFVDLLFGTSMAVLATTIIFVLKLKNATYFAIYVAFATIFLIATPLIANLFDEPTWIIGAKNAIAIIVRSISLIAVAAIFANKLPTHLVDQLRLKMPKRPIAAFVIPIGIWIALNIFLVLTPLASGADPHTQNHVELKYASLGNSAIAALVILALLVPLGEELLFRGFMVPLLRQVSNAAVAVLVSTVAFTLLHIGPDSSTIVSFSYVFGMGVLLATTTLLTQSIWPAVLVHIANNSVAIFVVVYA